MRALPYVVLLAFAAFMVWALGRAVDHEFAYAAPEPHKIGDGTLLRAISRERAQTWRCQRELARPLSPTSYHAERSRSLRFRKWAHRLWRRRSDLHCNTARQVGDMRAWLCIHRYEGAWNDPNPPYYGGLQMDYQFQATYGAALLRAKGTANNWTPLEQIIVAERARRSGRGFYPWPNAARLCGLI
jgi:hypothetical protein